MLPASLDSQLAAALAAERAKVQADDAAAFDAPSRTSAAGGWSLLRVHEDRAARVRASGDVAAFEALYRDISAEVAIPSVVIREADRRSFTGAVSEIGGGIAHDAGQLAQQTGSGWMALLKLSPVVLVALAVLAVVVFARRVTP
jgi:hypothetical protein